MKKIKFIKKSCLYFLSYSSKFRVLFLQKPFQVDAFLQSQIKHMSFYKNTDDYLNDIKLQQNQMLNSSISCIDWSPTLTDHFACTLWDGTLKIYQVVKQQNKAVFRTQNSFIKEIASLKITNQYPLTYCNWSNQNNAIFLGTSMGQIKAFDPNSGQVIDIGSHPAPINYIRALPEFGNTLLTSAYDTKVLFWNLNSKNPVQNIGYSKKIFRASFGGGILATALADQRLGLVNIRALHKRKQTESTQLGKYSQIQAIQMSKNGKYLGLGTIDGRVNISYIQQLPGLQYNWKSHITFKGHKTQQKDTVTLYPVNSVNFHPKEQSWFSTSGADGSMHFWDHQMKTRIKSFNFNSNPICYSSVSHCGRFIAYALGNDWHMGPQGEKYKPKLGVHEIPPNQLKNFK